MTSGALLAFDFVIAACFLLTWGAMYASHPSNLLLVAAGCFGTIALMAVTSAVTPVLFRTLCMNKAALPQDEVKKNAKKFAVMLLANVVCTLSCLYETRVFEETKWFTDPATIWAESPEGGVSDKISFFYAVVIGNWAAACLIFRFVEQRDPDFVLMYSHHVVTALLICGSYSNAVFMQAGVIVLFLHQTSDIVLQTCKMAHYLGFDADNLKPFGVPIPISEVLFVANLASWAFTRLWLLPQVTISPYITDSLSHPACRTAPHNLCHLLAFGILPVMVFLQLLHVYWFYKMLQIMAKLLSGSGAQGAADVYLEHDDELKEQKKNEKNK